MLTNKKEETLFLNELTLQSEVAEIILVNKKNAIVINSMNNIQERTGYNFVKRHGGCSFVLDGWRQLL